MYYLENGSQITNTCNGDSGGPLTVIIDGKATLIGEFIMIFLVVSICQLKPWNFLQEQPPMEV